MALSIYVLIDISVLEALSDIGSMLAPSQVHPGISDDAERERLAGIVLATYLFCGKRGERAR